MIRCMPYIPLTATPLRNKNEYREMLPEDLALHPYIRCFWGSEKPYWKNENAVSDLVIPDTCVDIIYYIDHTDHTLTSVFCGINDRGFRDGSTVGNGHLMSVFAIRFYAWGAYAFSEDSLAGTCNGFYEVPSRFRWLDERLRRPLLEHRLLTERTQIAERLLIRKMSDIRQNAVLNSAVQQILYQRGTTNAAQLAKDCFISSRQLERLFSRYIGITPKKLGNLVRYQFLWNEIMRNKEFSTLDAVVKYGFTDQSHLLREFKRYHTMDLSSAKRYAAKDVENIQYVSEILS